jgi:hypothetical protein
MTVPVASSAIGKKPAAHSVVSNPSMSSGLDNTVGASWTRLVYC